MFRRFLIALALLAFVGSSVGACIVKTGPRHGHRAHHVKKRKKPKKHKKRKHKKRGHDHRH